MELIKNVETKNNSWLNILLLEPCLGLGLSIKFELITIISIEVIVGIFKFHYTLTKIKKMNNNG